MIFFKGGLCFNSMRGIFLLGLIIGDSGLLKANWLGEMAREKKSTGKGLKRAHVILDMTAVHSPCTRHKTSAWRSL
jgi:hypothetical protein